LKFFNKIKLRVNFFSFCKNIENMFKKNKFNIVFLVILGII